MLTRKQLNTDRWNQLQSTNDTISQVENGQSFCIGSTALGSGTTRQAPACTAKTWSTLCFQVTTNSLTAASDNTLTATVDNLPTALVVTIAEGAGTGIFSASQAVPVAQFDLMRVNWLSDSVGTLVINGMGWGGHF